MESSHRHNPLDIRRKSPVANSTFGQPGKVKPFTQRNIFVYMTILVVILRADVTDNCDIVRLINTTEVYSYRVPESGELRVCLKCPPGSYRTGQCTSPGSLNHCRCCPENCFKFTYDNATSCQKCKPFCYEHNEIEIEECTLFSDLKCECRPGYYRSGENCYSHTACSPGQGVKTTGSPLDDTACEDCIPGETFSNESSAAALCSNCSVCPTEQATERGCILTRNTVCEGQQNTGRGWKAAVVVVSLVVVGIIVVSGICCYRRHRPNECQQRGVDPISEMATLLDQRKEEFRPIILAISQDCDPGWRMLIRSLPGEPVTEGDLNAIVHAHPGDLKEQIYKGLTKYTEINPMVTPEGFCDSLDANYQEMARKILNESPPAQLNGHSGNL